MKIYTYYQDIGFDYQQELLDLWQESWRRQNFDPIILGIEDAKKCPIYQTYYDFVQRIHENSVGKPLEKDNYCLAAQLEIAAFTTIDKDEPCYMSDYDVIATCHNKMFFYEKCKDDFPLPYTIDKPLFKKPIKSCRRRC